MLKVVKALSYEGFSMSLAQLFGSGPKWTIMCGECKSIFKARILVIDNPRVKCTLCETINEIPITVG